MKHHAFRLTYGMDLRQGIEDYCRDNNIHSAAIVTVVGCVYRARIRLADGETIEEYDDRYEIVSLTGTCTFHWLMKTAGSSAVTCVTAVWSIPLLR